jgi:hypothetical protein
MNATTQARLVRKVGAVCGAAVLLLGVTACGSDDAADGATDQTGSRNADGQSSQDDPAGRMPGANGKVAAVDGSTAQVQSQQDGQVAVTWNGSTTFTRQVDADLSDVEVGSCVLVAPDELPATDDANPPTEMPTEVTAGTVRITAKVDDSCEAQLAGPGGPAGPAGPPGDGQPPAGAPQGGAGEGPPMQVRGAAGAMGEVTAVSATGFTVASTRPDSDATTTVAVTVDGDTTFTTTAAATAADVEVGVCVQASGTSDDTGALTATRIAVSPPQDGECGGLLRFRAGDGSGDAAGTVEES